MQLQADATSVTLPAGFYLIGDPCYHVPDDQWDSVLEQSSYFDDQCWANFTTKSGRTGTVIAFHTAYGDGIYEDQHGRCYGVDAGMIGAIPLGDIETDIDFEVAHVVEFKAPFKCYERKGVIYFGNIRIDTVEEDDSDSYDTFIPMKSRKHLDSEEN